MSSDEGLEVFFALSSAAAICVVKSVFLLSVRRVNESGGREVDEARSG